jgi:hypothetical protein
VIEPVQPRLRVVFSAPASTAPVPRARIPRSPVPRSQPSRERTSGRRAASGATVAVLASIAGAAVAAHVQLRSEDPAGPAGEAVAPIDAQFRPPVASPLDTGTVPAGSRAPSESAKPQPASPRRFAWAPVEGASGYHVEIFEGDSLVFEARTSRPEISIATGRVFDGPPGKTGATSYRWYVWPIVAGERSSSAVVQATLSG